VCGDEYVQLEADVIQYDDEQWRALPEKVRGRLGAWCMLQKTEKFLCYLPDTDFSKHDAGLAGIVVTDQCIVYCKHHRRGSVALDEPGELLLSQDGPFFDVSYHCDNHRRRLVRVRGPDGSELVRALDALQRPLRVVEVIAS